MFEVSERNREGLFTFRLLNRLIFTAAALGESFLAHNRKIIHFQRFLYIHATTRTRIRYASKRVTPLGNYSCKRPMDFIERWFHLSADNGSGSTEAMYVMTLAASILVLLGHLQLAAVAKRWVATFQ